MTTDSVDFSIARLPAGSFEENRAWQTKLIAERTTPADRLHMLEGMLDELGNERIRQAIDQKLVTREALLNPPPPSDR